MMNHAKVKDIEMVPTSDSEELGKDNVKTENEKPPFSVAVLSHSVLENIIKHADQTSPLLLSKMPRIIAFTVAFLFFCAYAIAFCYQLGELYGANCTEANGCIACSISIGQTKGASCESLADTQIDIKAGCMSIGLDNNYDVISDILKNINAYVQKYKADFDPNFYESMSRHYTIVEAIQHNDKNQMTDPDPDKVRTFLKANFLGLSDGLSTHKAIDAVSDETIVAAGIKMIYSYISIGCAMTSQQANGYPTVNGIDYSTFDVCGCDLTCPTNLALVGGTIDPSIPIAASAQNGLGTVTLALPNKYVQTVVTQNNPPFSDELAAMEFIYFSETDGSAQHCPVSVFTGTPAKLNGVFYNCCLEKSDVEKLSEASAFASLALTFAVTATYIMFYRWSPKVKEEKDEEKQEQ